MFYINIYITEKKEENGTFVGLCFFYIVFIMSETGTVLIKLSCCHPLSERKASNGSLQFFYFKMCMLSLVCAHVRA